MIKSFCKANNLNIIGKILVFDKSDKREVEACIAISKITNKSETLSKEINLIVLENNIPIIVGMCRIAKVKRKNTGVEDWPLDDEAYKSGDDFLWTYMLRNLSVECPNDRQTPSKKYSGLGFILYKIAVELSYISGCNGRLITLSRVNISHKFHLDFGFKDYDFKTFPGGIPTFQAMYLPYEIIEKIKKQPMLDSSINFDLKFSPGLFSTKVQSFM